MPAMLQEAYKQIQLQLYRIQTERYTTMTERLEDMTRPQLQNLLAWAEKERPTPDQQKRIAEIRKALAKTEPKIHPEHNQFYTDTPRRYPRFSL